MVSQYANALDEILKLIHSEPRHLLYYQINEGQNIVAYRHLIDTFETKYNLPLHELDLLIKKLIEDGMIVDLYPTNKRGCYMVTFKGVDWVKFGGYKQERKYKHRDKASTRWTNVFLIVGSIATLFIAMNELTKTYEASKSLPPQQIQVVDSLKTDTIRK